MDALFRALASDYLLREQFVTDPAQIISEYVAGSRLDTESAASANQLVYAVVSNPGLLQWVQTYGARGREIPTGGQFVGDFASALASNGDSETLLAVLKAANEPYDRFSVQAAVLRALISASRHGGLGKGVTTERSPGVGAVSGASGAVFAGTQMSSPGTEISPGPGTEVSRAVFAGTQMSSPGTEISPGPGTELSRAVFAGTEHSSPGTEISPGHGTNMSPGLMAGTEHSSPGTEISPGHGTNMSPGLMAGTEHSSPGTEISPGHGTNMSPGLMAGTEHSSPGTEISPGHGTNMSPGTLPAQGGPIDVAVTLGALVEFAHELRRTGALSSIAF